MFRKFVRSTRMALVVAAAMLCVSLPGSAAPPANPFSGMWTGAFTTDNGGFGPVTLTVKPNGQLSGTVTYYPGHLAGELIGHVGADGFGAFIFQGNQSPPVVIPYLLYLSIDEQNQLQMIAPVPWDGGFTVFATLTRQ